MSTLIYTIDLTGVTTPREMHEVIKASLSLPEYYGMNLDALWDCLTAFVPLPCTVRIVGREQVPEALTTRVDALVDTLQEAAAYHAAHGRELTVLL